MLVWYRNVCSGGISAQGHCFVTDHAAPSETIMNSLIEPKSKMVRLMLSNQKVIIAPCRTAAKSCLPCAVEVSCVEAEVLQSCHALF